MTENEAVREMTFEEEYEILKKETNKLFGSEIERHEPHFANCVVRRALRCIRKLQNENEIQQYRAIGTVKECKAAVEKQTAQAPHIWGDGTDDKGQIIYDMYDCPNCGQSYEIDYDDYKYCPECGQKLERMRLNE